MKIAVLASVATTASCMVLGACDPISLDGVEAPDVVTAEARQEEPFLVTIQSAGMGTIPGCEAFPAPKALVRFHNRNGESIWIEGWTGYREGPWKFELRSATDHGGWGRTDLLYTNREAFGREDPENLVEIESGATHEFILLVGLGHSREPDRFLRESELRVTLDYYATPERSRVDRQRVILPVRFVSAVAEATPDP